MRGSSLAERGLFVAQAGGCEEMTADFDTCTFYPPGEASTAEYNCAIPPKKPIMEAEKLNALANILADLGARAKEMRRYL